MIRVCKLCPRQCAVSRTNGELGVCRQPAAAKVAKAMVHRWEEPCISGVRGSGAIFFSGCTLGCVYCQNSDIVSGNAGREVSAAELAGMIDELEGRGVHNINFVTGTHFIPEIIAALRMRKPKVPVVWNTGGYETAAAIDALQRYVDVWLPDYKYALTECAGKYSDAPDYPAIALDAIKRMRACQPEDQYDGDGVMTRGVIVRHLVLPGNTRNSIAALQELGMHLPGTKVSLMSQYIPAGRADEFPELSRKITRREYEKVVNIALGLGIDGYIQDMSAASESYVPDFQADADIVV